MWLITTEDNETKITNLSPYHYYMQTGESIIYAYKMSDYEVAHFVETEC